MSSRPARLTLSICLTLLTTGAALSRPPARVDAYGDPLPAGAVARLGTVRFRQQGALSLAYCPDGKVLVSGGTDGKVRLWDMTGAERSCLGGHPGGVSGVALSPDGALLASAGADKLVRLWDVAGRKELRVMRGHDKAPYSVAFSSDGRLLASGGLDNTVRVWETATGKEVRRFDTGAPGHYIFAVAFSPDGKLLAAAGEEKLIRLWEVTGWKELRPLKGHQNRITALAFAPDGKRIASCSDDKTVRLWDTDGRMQWRLADRSEFVYFVAFSADGKMLAAGDGAGGLTVWDMKGGRQMASWKAGSGPIHGLAFSPDGETLASADVRSDIRLWAPATGKRLSPSGAPTGGVRQLAFSPDGRRLAVVPAGQWQMRDVWQPQSVRLWDARTWKERARVREVEGPTADVAFSPDSKVLASVEEITLAVRLWDAETGKPLGFVPTQGLVHGLAFAPDGGVAWSDHKGLTIGDPRTGKVKLRLEKIALSWRTLSYSPDGRLLASVLEGGTIRLWDPSGEPLREFGHRHCGSTFVAFAPDGRTMASAGSDAPPVPVTRGWSGGWVPRAPVKEVWLWEVTTGAMRCRLCGHQGEVVAAAWSPNGRLVATSAEGERTARLWDAATGKELRRLQGHRGDVTALAFSPDGKLLAAGDGDSTVLIWDVPSLAPPRARPAGGLTARQFDGLWADLGGADSVRAYAAIASLADHPAPAGPLLRDAVKRLPVLDGKRLARLIADLDADEFSAREGASRELAALGVAAAPALKDAQSAKPSPEAARRIRELLRKLEGQRPPPGKVLALRAVEALERVGTPPAREALRELAAGSADPDIVREAKASLRHLERQRAAGP